MNAGDVYWSKSEGRYVPVDDSLLGKIKAGWNNFIGRMTGETNTRLQNEASAVEAQRNRDFNAEQAELQRDFEKDMSDTAVQRQAADYAAAGFNPVLAAQGGGASSVQAASATSTPGNMAANQNTLASTIASSAVAAAAVIKVIRSIAK